MIQTDKKTIRKTENKRGVSLKGKALFLFLVFSVMISWGTAHEKVAQVKNIDLQVKDVEIIGTKTFEGQLLGIDFDKNEVYIQLTLYPDEFYSIGIIDIETENIKKTFRLRKGNIQAPTEINNPTYMQYMDGQYYLIDWFDKIMVFNHELDYLYSNMFNHMRFFIDFYKGEDEPFFVIGRQEFGYKEIKCSVEIYQMIEKRKLEFIKKIHTVSHEALNFAKDSAGRYIMGPLWSSYWGFEKDRKIYIANSSENRYLVYELKHDKLEEVELRYLKGRKFSDDDAITVSLFVSGWLHDEKKAKYVAYPEKIYYFGFYDVGENKIGIVGDIDIGKMEFRLDIIRANSGEYLESIKLPIGHGFFRQIYEGSRGIFLTRINIDRGIYVWVNKEGEDFDFVVKLTRFSIKK